MGEGIDLRFDDSNEVKEYPLCLPSCDGSLINLIWALCIKSFVVYFWESERTGPRKSGINALEYLKWRACLD
ncbi:hypothetical protein PanWU01x14_337930 [Parasponia andersonii]|uniref:Uncharacterized protein n=1 Tax=Parasponia andersonii TaxID=3476 RepID=A0A2P5AFC0_PARAD|nr:hypothetical protein PanWU01x14_337930 [Parasponia andersonii]